MKNYFEEALKWTDFYRVKNFYLNEDSNNIFIKFEDGEFKITVCFGFKAGGYDFDSEEIEFKGSSLESASKEFYEWISNFPDYANQRVKELEEDKREEEENYQWYRSQGIPV